MSTRLGVKLVPSRIWTELAWKGSTSEKIHHQKTTASRRPNRGQISHNVTTAHRQNETQRLENNCTLLHHRTENRKRKIANHKLQKLQTTTTIRDIFCRTPNFFFFWAYASRPDDVLLLLSRSRKLSLVESSPTQWKNPASVNNFPAMTETATVFPSRHPGSISPFPTKRQRGTARKARLEKTAQSSRSRGKLAALTSSPIHAWQNDVRERTKSIRFCVYKFQRIRGRATKDCFGRRRRDHVTHGEWKRKDGIFLRLVGECGRRGLGGMSKIWNF